MTENLVSMTMVDGAPLSQLIYRQAASNQDIFSRLGRPAPRLPFPLPFTSGLFPRIPAPFNPNGETPLRPGGFPGFMHPFSQFHGRPFPFPGNLPHHHFMPNFKSERDIDAGKIRINFSWMTIKLSQNHIQDVLFIALFLE